MAGKAAATEPGRPTPPTEGGVQSIMRALAILNRLAGSDDGLTLTELAKGIALPPSTAHRILTTMQRDRFVRFEPATMTWHVGVQAFVVGNAFARSREMVPLAIPHLRHLMTRTGETANLFMLDGEEVVCMAQIQSQQMIRVISRPGGGVEMHRSAAGKAILAHMEVEDVAEILKRTGMRRYTEHTITTREALLAELARIRQRGFSIDNEEFSLGLRCIAAPIFDESGTVHAAVSLAGPASRITESRIDALGEMVALCGNSVTLEIGGRAQ
jgi:IclR family acetate operon transcriptional repressor